MEQNEIRIELQDSIAVLDILGDITVFSETSLNGAYDEVSGHGVKKIVFKFDTNAYINSGGIALLIQLLARSRKNDQKVAITGLSSHFKKIFRMVGITKFAEIYDSLEEALTEMSSLS